MKGLLILFGLFVFLVFSHINFAEEKSKSKSDREPRDRDETSRQAGEFANTDTNNYSSGNSSDAVLWDVDGGCGSAFMDH